MVDANVTALVTLSRHFAVADTRFKGIKATTNRQKIGLIKFNCSAELSVMIFRSSQVVKNISL